MAFDNQLGRGKDWRKPYYDLARRSDWQCRHGGSCTWCSRNRQFVSKRRMPIEEQGRGTGCDVSSSTTL
jgi:hypothetical protein